MAYYHSRYSGSQRKKFKLNAFLTSLLLIILLGIGGGAYYVYKIIYSPNVWLSNPEVNFKIYIKASDTFDDLKSQLYSNGLIVHRNDFEWWAKQKNLITNLKPGMYKVAHGMSNNDLINKLRSGNQDPVHLIFNNIRLKKDLASKISKQLDIDSTEFINRLNDSAIAAKYGFTNSTFIGMFIPNTYFINWNITPERLIERMNFEYKQFWNSARKEKAQLVGLSEIEVSILASIIEKETQKNDEKARIAGVYLNRLKRGWRLQADPTLVFAIGDFTIKRVLYEYMQFESPYNTYKYAGLPPGPICLPSISSIDAVLNAENHNFVFFCARPDYSGYHNFATNSAQHAANAEAYRSFLNRERIYK